MKRVLIFSDGWKRLLTYAWTAGAMDYVKDKGADVTVDQFNCWGDWSLNRAFNEGEYAVYELPDLQDYDGIIVDINNIAHPEVLEKLLGRIRESGLPAVSLCSDVEGLYYAGINGRRAVSEMIHHLYQVHGCRSFFFAGGPRGNYENEERAAAFHDCMIELGLPEYADRIVYSDFDADGGHYCMRYLLEHKLPLPDAVVCANDNIAVGLIGEAEQQGYKVPRDFRVTGFDYFDKAAWFEPQLSTAVLHREEIGALAMQVLERVWAGEAVPHYNYTTARLIYTESCGCPNTGTIDYRGYVRSQVLGIIKGQDTDAEIAKLESELAEADHTQTFARRVAQQYGSMDCDGCAVFLDPQILDPGEDAYNPAQPEKTSGRQDPRLDGVSAATGAMTRLAAGETIGAFLARRGEEDRGCVYYHMPLHIDEKSAGVVVLRNPRFLLVHFDIFEIQEAIPFVLKSLYQNAQLRAALAALQRIYDRDQLTGAYNRSAFEEKILPVYRRWDNENRPVAVIFMDVDHFKEINDTYGHAYGDEVLRKAAKAMQQFLPAEGYLCRYGGDEFLALFPIGEEREAAAYRDQVETALAADGVSLSVGIQTGTGQSLEAGVKAADRAMYAVKEQHHAQRYQESF